MEKKEPVPPRRRIVALLADRRGKYYMIALWLVLLAVAGPLALKLTDVQNNDTLGALPGDAEAAVAKARAEAAFPEPDALLAVAVYVRDAGLTAADRAKVDSDRAAFARFALDGQLPTPRPSDDGAALVMMFRLAGDPEAQEAATATIKDTMAADAPAGLRCALTGAAGHKDDVFDAFAGMDGRLLLATACTVAVLLLLTYRSPALWLVPLIIVAVASQIANAVSYLLAKHGGLTVDLQGQSVLTVLVFGVGVDYALLLIARYREELRRREDRHEAMAIALRRSLPAICASAATVAVSLLCLLAADLPATRGLGPIGAIGITAAFAAMTTLLPAVLVLFGRWLFWPFVPRYSPGAVGHDIAEDHGLWRRVANVVGRRPRAVWLGTAAALACLTLGVTQLSTTLPLEDTFTTEVGSVTGQHLIEAHYPGGSAGPADLLARAAAADRVIGVARQTSGVAEIGEPTRSADGRWIRLTVVLADAPDSAAAMETVKRLRTAVHDVPDADAVVGGETAETVDRRRTVREDDLVVIPLVLGVVLLVLITLLRALVVPLLLLVSVVASYAAAMGAAGLVLTAIGYPDLNEGVPLQAFLFLVALGVDYTIFLMTRAREEAGRIGHRGGILHSLTVTGGVITSAGVVLAATFASLGVMPLVPSIQMGIVVALGVLLDTFLVRSLLVPALVLDVGPRAWWPGAPARTKAPAHPALSNPRDLTTVS